MNIKKRVAGLLALALLANPLTTLGNVQDKLPADGIDYIQVAHDTLNSGSITPQATVTFKVAKNSTTSDNPYYDLSEAEFYRFSLTDAFGKTLSGSDITKADSERDATFLTRNIENQLEDPSEFLNGTLYKLEVIPGHYHKNQDGVVFGEAPLSSAGENPVRYFVTDFDTIARENGDDIEILWEYIPGASYTLKYIDKDVTTKDEVDAGGVGSVEVSLKPDDVEVITENGVKKVKYVLEDTIPGQKYSAYVVVDNIVSSFLKDKIANVGMNKSTPKVANVSRSVSLSIRNISNKRIVLDWELGSWADGKLVTTKIWRKTEGETAYTQIGTINNEGLSPQDPGKFEHDEPNKISTYYVEFILKDGTIYTKEVPYVPYELREQPLKPQIPLPFSSSLKDSEGFNKKDYLVTNDDISLEKMDPNTFKVSSLNPLQVQLVWDAPKIEVDGAEQIEYEMVYDIWVSNDRDTLEDIGYDPLIENLSISAGNEKELIKMQDNKTVIGFKTILDRYRNYEGEIKSLVTNETYYIKIIAKRPYGEEYSLSMPTVVAITIDKNGDIFTPPVLAKPPLRVQEGSITQTTVKIEWLEKWYEIKAKSIAAYTDEDELFFAELWNSKVYTGGSPAIKFKGETKLTEHILKSEKDLEVVKKTVGADTYASDYIDREVSLGSDVQYEVKTLLYDEVLTQIKKENVSLTTASAITIEKWIVQNESESTEGWKTVSPGDLTYADGLEWKDYELTGLKPNTRYVIMIRAYRVLDSGKKLQQTFPSYVIATTESDYVAPEATPKVPNLNANGVTDTSVSVWWVYNKDFDYEIVYSRLEDPNSAKTWEFTISDVAGDDHYVADGGKAIVTITGLLPETTYNVWIRAKQKEGNKVSEWSNPITQTTSPIEKPDVPRGLGPAAYQSILELGLDFLGVGSDYITVEWIKDVEDVEEDDLGEAGKKVYSYVLEFADNPEFLDAINVSVTDELGNGTGYEILSKNIVKFTGLIGNRPYYVKVKTVLTFTDEETGRTVVKESEFTRMVRIITKTSGNEYDEGDNDNIVIYPDAVEEEYKDNVWTWEIVDSAKIISEILSKKEYYYTITLEKYKNKYTAKNRIVKMQKSVLDTLINQKMALRIITEVGVYEIPAVGLEVYSKLHTATDKVQFELTTVNASDIYAYARSYPDMLVSGERLQISLRGNQLRTDVKKLDEYMRVRLLLPSYQSYLFKDYYTYSYRYDLGSWIKETNKVENEMSAQKTYLSYATVIPGLFGLYEKTLSSSNTISYNMSQLTNDYNIKGLGNVYYSKDFVHRNQFIQLVMGLAQNKSAIDLTASLSSAEIKQAQSLGFFIGNNSEAITAQEAMVGITKLYELKSGYRVKGSSMNFTGVSTTYKEAVAKAYAIGLIDSSFNGASKVTYTTLCDWLLQVTE